jgi:two-component system, OmpR family, sensor kinase
MKTAASASDHAAGRARPPTDTVPTLDLAEVPPRWRRILASLRGRIVAWHVVMLVLGVALVIATIHLALLADLDERIDQQLRQEVDELRALAVGLDPITGEPFGDDVERLFEVFLSRNLPMRNEYLVTFIDGALFRRSVDAQPGPLDVAPALADRWAGIERSTRGRVEVPEVGRVEYLGVPVRVDGTPAGVFVVAHFRDLERAELNQALRNAVLIGLVVLAFAMAVAWTVAGRILEPVHQLTTTARAITDSDLSRRIPVRGADEVSVLAATFNHMLARLDAAFDSQRGFLDDVGHELRTPITIIRGHLELLDHDSPEERAETVALVVDELDRMHRMVEDLLLLAKAEQPDFLDLQPVDVEALTRGVFAKAQALAPRDWRLEDVGRARIVADRQRLTQVLVQLCQNAVQHTEPDDCIALGSAVAGGHVHLWVRDAGAGIATDEQEHIFERFARGATRQAGSAGLGLAIVRAIVEAHRGHVQLSSAPGQGTTVTVVVPIDLEAPS